MWKWAQITFQTSFCLNLTFSILTFTSQTIGETINIFGFDYWDKLINYVLPLLLFLIEWMMAFVVFDFRHFFLGSLLFYISYTIYIVLYATFSKILVKEMHNLREILKLVALIVFIQLSSFLVLWFLTKIKNSCFRSKITQDYDVISRSS
jgi:hypothetical protein